MFLLSTNQTSNCCPFIIHSFFFFFFGTAGDYQVYNPYGGFQGQDLGSYNAAGPNLGQSEYLYESSATKMRTIPERM